MRLEELALRFSLSPLKPEMFMVSSLMSRTMLGNGRLLALCTLAALALSAGCNPDSPTVAGPDSQSDQTGLGAGGHPEISLLTGGATQISGIGSYAGPAECNDPEGQGSDYDLIMRGDLEGCHYVFVESAVCSAGGAYRETGTETFVGAYNGTPGTFRTTYLFTATYKDCANLTGEIAGRCQHPITAGSGEGVFEGVTGRLDMQDDIEAGNFPYRGHFRWATNDLLASSSTAFSSGTLVAPRSLPGC
jgi:hypothetical protein